MAVDVQQPAEQRRQQTFATVVCAASFVHRSVDQNDDVLAQIARTPVPEVGKKTWFRGKIGPCIQY
jgi:hypothetical protein